MRKLLLIPILAIPLVSCNHSDHSGQQQVRIQSVGGMADDPVRAVVYVSDADQGIVYELDTERLRIQRRVTLGAPLAELAPDPCGTVLYVCQTRFPLLSVVDLDSFQVTDHIALPGHPLRLVAADDAVHLTSSVGLLEVRPDRRAVRVLAADVAADAHLARSRAGDALFCAEGLPSGVRVRRFDAAGNLVQEATLPGTDVVSLLASHDGTLLYLGLGDTGDLLVLGSTDLVLQQSVDFGAALTTVALNDTTTRAYAVGTGLGIDERNTRDFQTGVGGVLSASLTDGTGLHLVNDGQTLITQQGDRLARQGLFDDEVAGPPAATMGDTWELRVRGAPGARAVVFWALDPGFVFLDPAGTPRARFLDLDPVTLRVLTVVALDASGEFRRTYQVPAGAPPIPEVLLQAATLDGNLLDVTNPRPVQLHDPADCATTRRFLLRR